MASEKPLIDGESPKDIPQRRQNDNLTVDWAALRARSLLPGGFGADRIEIWPQLLGVSVAVPIKQEEEDTVTPHRDERQIRLDTERSFVLYPVDASADKKDVMQETLHNLIVSVFRKRPKLHYFQGYHDIISVIFLTLPPEMRLVCAEKLSLHRVRDSMGSTLEPVLGLLRVTKNLLRLADLSYARSLERSSPLPFYALSNLLTLFSHDMPSLPLIQHVFDYLLCRPPIAVVYLATAIILERKREIEKLEQEEGEDSGMGMAHSLLSGLPDLVDAEVLAQTDEAEVKAEPQVIEIKQEESSIMDEGSLASEQDDTLVEQTPVLKVKDDIEDIQTSGPILTDEFHPQNTSLQDEAQINEPGLDKSEVEASLDSLERAPKAELSRLSTPSPSPSLTRSIPSPPKARVPPTTLTSLLARADELSELYSPVHLGMAVSSIMGPQSVLFTWNEDFKALPNDAEAEAMVSCPGLIVYPYIEEGDDEVGEDGEGDEWDEKGGKGEKKRTGKGKRWWRDKAKDKRQSRKLRKTRMVERRAMVASAVLVLGVAVAVYGMKVHSSGGHGSGNGVFGLGSVAGGREWKGLNLKKVGGWVGGLVLGATEKILSSGVGEVKK